METSEKTNIITRISSFMGLAGSLVRLERDRDLRSVVNLAGTVIVFASTFIPAKEA